MNIIIPIKQVPETSNVKMDKETGTMIRDGVQTVINPLDLYALEAGIQIKEKYDGNITVLTMGPPSAEKALREAIAMGCDNAILISDKQFAGSDTWATSYTLSETIKTIREYDLIITGERATDGDTGQVGPGLAAWLDLPLATYVSNINRICESSISVERLTEEGYQKLVLHLPAIITVVKEICSPRLPTLSGKKKARTTEIVLYSTKNLDLKSSALGLNGSPTKVVKIDFPKIARKGILVKAEGEKGLEDAVDQLIFFLQQKDLI